MANLYAPQNWQLWGINRAKTKKTKPQKNCDLCGAKLGEKYFIGLTHPKIKLGAITCLDTKCTRWLKIKGLIVEEG
jgi:hypothetical protein